MKHPLISIYRKCLTIFTAKALISKKPILLLGIIGAAICLLQITGCGKKDFLNPPIKVPDYLLHGYEIKDTLNPTLIDSNFSFSADGSLYSVNDLQTKSEMDFSYINGERQSNSTYSYLYDANKNLYAIGLPNGKYQLDSLLLYPNGYIKQYKHAFDVNPTSGVAYYITYNYNYGGVIPASGPIYDPLTISGKGVAYDNAGNLVHNISDYYQLSYNFPFNSGYTLLMSICNNSKVHFLNLRLWSPVPIMNVSGITKVVRTYSDQHFNNIPPPITITTDNFTYEVDSKSRPVCIIKNDGTTTKAIYNIVYHD